MFFNNYHISNKTFKKILKKLFYWTIEMESLKLLLPNLNPRYLNALKPFHCGHMFLVGDGLRCSLYALWSKKTKALPFVSVKDLQGYCQRSPASRPFQIVINHNLVLKNIYIYIRFLFIIILKASCSNKVQRIDWHLFYSYTIYKIMLFQFILDRKSVV